MRVWVVTVDSEVIGAYASESSARKAQEDCINENVHDMIAFDCDPTIVVITECELDN